MKFHWIMGAVLVAALAFLHAPARADEAGDALAEKLLSAVGGREAWAAATSTTNVSIQNRTEAPHEVRATIWADFTSMRFYLRNEAEGFFSQRAYTPEGHWRQKNDGTIEDMPPDLLENDLRWFGAHVYRTIHRIAVRDETLSFGVAEDGRLFVFEGGKRLLWFRLDTRGQPYAFGQWDDETGSICGPWRPAAGGIFHPAWTSQPDGMWRVMLERVEVNTPFDPALFARPGG